ncbi:amidophosphoribosyltransferase [Desulfoscipio gibsoniae]|uniref:Amidophosphoribosyltransferase n=1 Tax=Desulfoscipio gibsoniae DSM 7213 TaxID=767817 RepID=R4KUZ2_9FIRM|nr:amidophosphoribosyltransferase [Desulfoscipio gibsoniae]AGL03436.1 glutamine phosphoribosylpyrophosphate amidotransferase [Desulfoscipio gibsoniae DSM 7213]
MGGFFGVVSKEDCVNDVYFGTDYHSHLGTSMGGMAVWSGNSFNRAIHNIKNTQFRAKFESELSNLKGNMGIGCISDTEPQPLTVCSRLGQYAISTVGRINNLYEIVDKAFANQHAHFLETNRGAIYPTELVSVIIDQENSFKDGLLKAQEMIEGSCSILILTPQGIYASRDKLGRTPLIVGEKEGSYCVSFESCTFANLGYRFNYELGPGEIIYLTPDGIEKIAPPRDKMKICAFLWVYYGYPSSTYEGMNVEVMRYRNGAAMAENDNVEIDMVAGIPDSGTGHAIGYSNQSKIPLGRPFIKYTPTWARSFMPQDQTIRNLVARMKLMPIPDLVSGKRLLFCDDSIVRGTQLRETVDLLYRCNAREVHVRSACPPLVFGCKYLNFSSSRSEMDLVARQAIIEIEGKEPESFEAYCDPTNEKYNCMVNSIRKILNFSTLKYQNLHDMLDAIGINKDKICTYCWNGKG